MDNKKDINYIAHLERAVSQKYGEEATINPRSLWNDEKEAKYKEQVIKMKEIKKENVTIEKRQGFSIEQGLINKGKRQCCACNKYSFNLRDDYYLTKYETCEKCYIVYIEGREERWVNGWRPSDKERK
jgi:hypothetical protein